MLNTSKKVQVIIVWFYRELQYKYNDLFLILEQSVLMQQYMINVALGLYDFFFFFLSNLCFVAVFYNEQKCFFKFIIIIMQTKFKVTFSS